MAIKCCNCGKEEFAICISEDGDFVCDSLCKNAYERKKATFFDEILPGNKKLKQWLLGGE